VAPQFGRPLPGQIHADRPAAFGIAERDSLIAVVRIAKADGGAWADPPRGATAPGEGAAMAVVREFGEETGLKVAAGEIYARADQLFLNTDGRAYNNRASFFEVSVVAEAGDLKVEDDHTLDWISPDEALRILRHEAHAWAVTAWLRRRRRDGPRSLTDVVTQASER
jgi:8-oxo-dGTP diphosphatase